MQVQPPRYVRVRENCLQLRPEEDLSILAPVVQRLHSRPVPRQRQPAFAFIPDSDSEHSAEPCEAFQSPLQECIEYHLGVAVRPEGPPSAFQVLTNLSVVVYLAIEDDRALMLSIVHRLVAVLYIHNAQPCRSHGCVPRHKALLAVRSAMYQAF